MAGGGPSTAISRSSRRLRVSVAILATAVVALAVALGVVEATRTGSGGARGASSSVGTGAPSTSSTRPGSPGGAPSSPARPKVLVAVTTAGVLEDLDPSTGSPIRTLATGATGDELSVTPDGSSVYFEAAVGCMHQIERVGVAGGSASVVATGSSPAISPDGTKLAYVREPLAGEPACQGQSFSPSQFTLVVRDLSSGAETTYPVAPQVASTGLPTPIDHLSWSSDSQEIAVSVASSEDNEGWQLVVVHLSTDEFYFSGSGVPLTGSNASASYYREGVFMPDGDLFVNRVCCGGVPIQVSSSLLLEVSPGSGSVVRQVAIGITANDHTSLDSDSSGHWLLYLSGAALYVSENGNRPTVLASGFRAAAW